MFIARLSIVAVAIISASFLASSTGKAEEVWEVFETGTRASLRGLSATSNEVAWACGSQGTIVQTIDGGASWLRHSIPGLPSVEIRSIHAWDSNTAIVATAGQPALILKTVDRGATWTPTYENRSPQAFFDAMRFWKHDIGIAFSDPIDGGLLILKTVDSGDSWNAIEPGSIPKMDLGEAGFAASNSSLHAFGDEHAWIGLGGASDGVSRVLRSIDGAKHWTAHFVTPIARGTSSGVFSIAFETALKGIAVGGDYNKITLDTQNIAITDDGGQNWRAPHANRPRGFRSSVVTLRVGRNDTPDAQTVWLTCGPSGCEWSTVGEEWTAMSEIGFHSLSVGAGNSVWASGADGRMARLKGSLLQAFTGE